MALFTQQPPLPSEAQERFEQLQQAQRLPSLKQRVEASQKILGLEPPKPVVFHDPMHELLERTAETA